MSTNPERTRATAFGLIKERDQSGSFPIGRADDSQQLESDAVIAELAPDLVSLIPEPPAAARRSVPPRPPTPSERAELVIEDLSLQLDNPYLASSLVPPPKRPMPLRRVVAIASGMLAAAAIGAVIQLGVLRSGQESPAPAPEGGVAAPAPVVAAVQPPQRREPPREVVATEPVAAQPQSVVAPVESAPAVEVAPAAPAAPAASEKRREPTVARPVTAARPAPVAAFNPPAPPEPAVAPEAATLAPTPSAPAADLPEYPTREQVTAGFESVRSALAQCAAGRSGRAEIKASIASNGRIAHALVGGDFDGSPEGSCMARAVRAAQFPAFSQERLKVSYPFAL